MVDNHLTLLVTKYTNTETMDDRVTKSENNTKTDSKGCLLMLMGICLITFLINFTYLYNLAIGPTNIRDVDLSDPGLIRYVEGSGNMQKIGSGETKILKLEIDGYFLMEDQDKKVLILHDPEFRGSHVSGRLEKLSQDEQDAFGMIPNLAPRKVDACVSYLWSTNLFMLIAVPLFPIVLLLLLFSFIKDAFAKKIS